MILLKSIALVVAAGAVGIAGGLLMASTWPL